MHVPPGFTTVFPYIFVKDAKAYMDFLVKGLGGEITRVDEADGIVSNAFVSFGDCTLMLSEARGQWQPTYGTYYRYAENADEAMARGVAAGGTVRMEVMDMTYGERQGGLTDLAGNVWWISQRLDAGSYAPA